MSAAGAGNEEDPEVEVVEEPGEVVTVPEPEEGDGDPAPRAPADPNRPDRATRRADRMREEKERADAAEARQRQTEERIQQVMRDNAELRGFVQAQAQNNRQDPKAATAARVQALEDEANQHLANAAAMAKSGDQAGNARELRAYHAKIRESAKVEWEAEQGPKLEQRFRDAQAGVLTPQAAAAREEMLAHAPWLRTDAMARAATDAEITRLVEAGRPYELVTFKEAASNVAKRLNLGGRQAPTQESRQRFAGTAGNEGGGGGDDNRVTMTANDKKLAYKTFPNLDKK